MKILHIITSLKMGGAETALFNFLRYTKQHYTTQHYVAYIHDGPFVQKIRDLGITVHCIRGWFVSHDLGTYIKLCKLIKVYKPDLLHTSLWSANFLGRMLARHFALPILSELHGDCRVVSQSWKNKLDSKTITGLQKQRIVAVADGVREAYQETIIGAIISPVKKDHVTQQLVVIKNGIDVAALQGAKDNPLLRADFGLSEHDFVIGSVGRLEAIKSYDILLRAFSVAWQPGMKLCLVGDGAERQNLENLAQDLCISEHVFFMGQRTDGYRFYQLFDCFALSSQTEGLSLALLEALAFGLPVITTNKNQHHEILADGVNGFLVPINDIEAYALSIKKIYASLELLQSMSKENLLLIQQFDLGHVVAHYQTLYRELCQSN